ncbi:MAG: 2-succinyl-5-enolpyruvyl-6-hydroxy-3-cyclohexene-1-carboxylic-acid synthase [Rhodocyclaceae bacterium]|jgi:2-succinyl-5-enolpyruvyl-6-hydroxy-3-cyclohexene-1-carboxylate synthase|nr:2-succinyl-5-enolpyruvyl-6-hydroxy-3-cyclohexene-1-carboxylic-acid synthase [Rhodocyclaceae bacterium]
MNTGERNLVWADALVAAFAAAGVRHAVLAPGARSAPLITACLRRPEIECHVINDERAAGFFALGIGKATRRPALVLTTSGTAAANLFPAVVEANLACVPLIALTADRPPELLGWGANQTIEQTKLYGDHVRAFQALPLPEDGLGRFLTALAARLVETTLHPTPGPVHANVPFREPLLPEALPAPPPLPAPIAIHPGAAAAPEDLDAVAARLSGRSGVIVCGAADYPAGFAEAIARLAAVLDAPVIAEALSNLRFGPHDKSRFISHAARLLRQSELPSPAWVLRFGRFPVSRSIERWLAELAAAEHLLVAAPGEWPDPLWRSVTLLRGDPLAVVQALAAACRPAKTDYCARWRQAEACAALAANTFFEGSVARLLLAALPAGAHCFVGNSLAIRAVDAFGGMGDTPLTLHGNRGASGIDGNLATTAGIAAATGADTVALVGDQTLLHDATSLALCARHGVTVVVLDNGGGGIFDHLPIARALPPELLARGWTAPQRQDFAALATAFGLCHRRADSLDTLAAALAPLPRGCLIEAVIDPRVSQSCFSS